MDEINPDHEPAGGDAPSQVTRILQRSDKTEDIPEELLPVVYEELRRMARMQMSKESPGQTLQPTALVHEAYLRLFQGVENSWENRGHFFGAAARSMRQILINRAKSKKAEKHGGAMLRKEFNDEIFAKEPEPDWLLTLDAALEKLEKIDSRKAQVVMLRYFAGLSIDDAASALGISTATVTREWRFAKAWLHREISRSI